MAWPHKPAYMPGKADSALKYPTPQTANNISGPGQSQGSALKKSGFMGVKNGPTAGLLAAMMKAAQGKK